MTTLLREGLVPHLVLWLFSLNFFGQKTTQVITWLAEESILPVSSEAETDTITLMKREILNL